MTTAAPNAIEKTDPGHTPAGLLLEHIATASLLEEEKFTTRSSCDDVEDDSEEVFEDGDESGAEREKQEEEREEGDRRHESVAAVLTELSQATAQNSSNSTDTSSTTTTATTNSNTMPSRPSTNPQMAATINSINAYLQSHLISVPSSLPQKARLYGPIRANVNIRHGVWAPRLRCRKRKNLHAKDGIWINPTCTLEHLIYLVKGVLPDEFEWDPQASPLRYQAVNDQSLQSLKTVSGTVTNGQSLFSAFDLVRNRRSDGDNFILQLYVYGTWTVLLKPHSYPLSTAGEEEAAVSLQPPPKKKYQQAHYSQQQQFNMISAEDSTTPAANTTQTPAMFHMRLSPPSSSITSPATGTATTSAAYYSSPHPLSANPPVTFLPTVTLEMKMNGIFVPVEISRRSFVSAIRACSIPKPVNVNNNSNIDNCSSNNNNSNNHNSNENENANNITPPPSDA